MLSIGSPLVSAASFDFSDPFNIGMIVRIQFLDVSDRFILAIENGAGSNRASCAHCKAPVLGLFGKIVFLSCNDKNRLYGDWTQHKNSQKRARVEPETSRAMGRFKCGLGNFVTDLTHKVPQAPERRR